jgi:hypothetical protein
MSISKKQVRDAAIDLAKRVAGFFIGKGIWTLISYLLSL